MILDLLPRLNQRKIVLASASPRRKELLEQMGLRFQVIPSSFEENLPKDKFIPSQYAEETAARKAMDVASQLSDVDLLIGADTVVESPCGAILEKPEDDADALRMLKLLSGREHAVHTGCVLISFDKEGKPVVKKRFSSTTKVTFDNVGEEELKAYIETREPFGKAGAYGIQGRAGVFVNHLAGCYFNVVGLPINRLSVELRELVTTAGDMKI